MIEAQTLWLAAPVVIASPTVEQRYQYPQPKTSTAPEVLADAGAVNLNPMN